MTQIRDHSASEPWVVLTELPLVIAQISQRDFLQTPGDVDLFCLVFVQLRWAIAASLARPVKIKAQKLRQLKNNNAFPKMKRMRVSYFWNVAGYWSYKMCEFSISLLLAGVTISEHNNEPRKAGLSTKKPLMALWSNKSVRICKRVYDYCQLNFSTQYSDLFNCVYDIMYPVSSACRCLLLFFLCVLQGKTNPFIFTVTSISLAWLCSPCSCEALWMHTKECVQLISKCKTLLYGFCHLAFLDVRLMRNPVVPVSSATLKKVCL